MTFNHKLVDELLKAIFPLPEKFGMICGDGDFDEDEPINLWSFQEAVWNVDSAADICFGMSKIVIISPNLGNVVIKIPFNGYYMEEGLDRDLVWYPFYFATGSDPTDYCLAEFEKCNKLKTYGLNCFVANTMFYKKIGGVRIFLQEQVTPENDSYCTCKPSGKSKDLADKWYSERKFNIEPEWIANCLDRYGKSKVKRFLYYCANVDPDILADAHDGNYGYRRDDTPCVLDYSNYSD